MVRWLAGSARLSLRQRIVVVGVTLLFGLVLVALAPRIATKRLRALVTAHASSADPAWNIPVDGGAFRRAAAVVRPGSTYYLSYPPSQLQYAHDLLGAGLLFLTPALPVRYPPDADWIIAYKTAPTAPPGSRAVKTIRFADGMYLVRTAR
jgi:hypothetical protein